MTRNGQRWLRGILLTVGIFTALCMILVPWLGRRMLRKDYAEAVPQTGVATVALMVEERVDVGRGITYPPAVLVRFHGAVQRVREVTKMDIAGLHVDQKVKITYRIGRSGRVYIDQLAPLPAPIPSASRR